MARRDPASRSSSSSSRSSARNRGAGPRTRSDGKVDIYCPQCAAHFRIDVANIEAKVTCSECSRTFFAKSTLGKRTKGQDYTKVYVGLGVGAVFIIGTLVLMSRGGQQPVQQPVVAADPNAQLEADRQARRTQAMNWPRAITDGNLVLLRTYSDVPPLLQKLGVEASLTGDAQDAAVLAALKTNEATRLFSEMDCTNVEIAADAVRAGSGAATYYLSVKPGVDYYDPKIGAQITVQWRLEGTQFKVADFFLSGKPVIKGRRPGDEDKTFKPSAEIAKPKTTEIEVNGRTKKVAEADPVPIAHLADTPPDLQKKIDDLVAELLRSAEPDAPGHLFGRTTAQLKEIGKPAMPRLINALHGLYGDVNGNNQKISQVTRALLDLAGMGFAYDVKGTGDAQKDKAARESVIRQWFAWWWRWANGDYQYAIDKDEDLDAPAKPADAKAGK